MYKQNSCILELTMGIRLISNVVMTCMYSPQTMISNWTDKKAVYNILNMFNSDKLSMQQACPKIPLKAEILSFSCNISLKKKKIHVYEENYLTIPKNSYILVPVALLP